jgi:hypothetical protein
LYCVDFVGGNAMLRIFRALNTCHLRSVNPNLSS